MIRESDLSLSYAKRVTAFIGSVKDDCILAGSMLNHEKAELVAIRFHATYEQITCREERMQLIPRAC